MEKFYSEVCTQKGKEMIAWEHRTMCPWSSGSLKSEQTMVWLLTAFNSLQYCFYYSFLST
jgi:hypothetical protein